MDIVLDEQARDWRDRAARFATEELIPWEVEAELHEGRLPPEVEARHKKLAIELGFSAMDVPTAHGGRDARVVDQVAVWEQLGRVTNALVLVLLRAAALDVRGLHARSSSSASSCRS